MSKPLRVISIDGTRGSGKSSQIGLLSKFFKNTGMKVKTIKMVDGDPILSGLMALQEAEAILTQGPEYMVMFEGSIARPIVVDIMAGMSTPDLLEKYKRLTQAYEKIDHKYGVASFLLVMDDMTECNRRIKKLRSLMGLELTVDFDTVVEREVVSGLRYFNNHIASKNISFQTLNVLPHQSMMEISDSLLKKLDEKYDFAKPKKTLDDW